MLADVQLGSRMLCCCGVSVCSTNNKGATCEPALVLLPEAGRACSRIPLTWKRSRSDKISPEDAKCMFYPKWFKKKNVLGIRTCGISLKTTFYYNTETRLVPLIIYILNLAVCVFRIGGGGSVCQQWRLNVTFSTLLNVLENSGCWSTRKVLVFIVLTKMLIFPPKKNKVNFRSEKICCWRRQRWYWSEYWTNLWDLKNIKLSMNSWKKQRQKREM